MVLDSTNFFLINLITCRFITNSTNMKTPCKLLQMSVRRKKTASGDINAIASTLQETPITMNNFKYKQKLQSKKEQLKIFDANNNCKRS